MKKFAIIVMVMVGLCMAGTYYPMPLEADVPETQGGASKPVTGIQIGVVGDSRAILGPAGKNIVVSTDGTVGVIFGAQYTPYDADQPISGVTVAYSTDFGSTWNNFGPTAVGTPPFRRCYPSIDACENFHETAGNTFFAWMEAPLGYATCPNYTMLDENLPSSPSFSTPALLPNDIYPWMPCITVDPDDNSHLICAGWSMLLNGDYNVYYWESDDGGYSWGDTSRLATYIEDSLIDHGPFRFGKDGYGFYSYHDADNAHVNRIPYWRETTDYGATWLDPDSIVPLAYDNLWWSEFDMEVCRDLAGNNFPVQMHNDTQDGSGFSQLFYPNPDDPGGPGAWNWIVTNLDGAVNGAYAFQGTTWTVAVGRNANGGMNVAFEPNLNVILVTFRGNWTASPPPVDWEDGDYLGGYVSINGGRDWRVTRPLTGLIDNPSTYAPCIEMAHRLVEDGDRGDIYCFTVWCGGGTQEDMPLYFELGKVLPIDTTGWYPGVGEYDDGEVTHGFGLSIRPTIANGNDCHVAFNIVNPGEVTVKVYDASGRMVDNTFNGHCGVGTHNVDVNTSALANGVYIVSLKQNGITETAKFVNTR